MARELARLEVSPARRTAGVAMQGGLGLFLLYLVATRPMGSAMASLILAVAGFTMIWFAWRFWQATEVSIVLTTDGLFDSNGRFFCNFSDIAKVDRGFFAFRPSAGFVISTKSPVARGWAPGLWWAFGKRIGIGGATGRAGGKQMSDIISVMLTERGNEIRARKDD
ncbi:MAG: hypothetical protein L3J37_12285 [Rhodobacteraceae bacterium]|nr:hypothetical protein [Paracoccaceae bacterium]